MRYSLITDIDGTLLKKTEIPPVSVIHSLQSFMEQGNLVSLCTGRPFHACSNLFPHLPEKIAPSIFFGGALIWDVMNKREISSISCDRRIFDLIKEIYDKYPSVSITMNTSEEAWTLRSNSTLQSRAIPYDRDAQMIYTLPSSDKRILKVLLTSENPSELIEIEETMIDKSLFHGNFASSHFYDITDTKVHKGTAIKTLKEVIPEIKECTVWAAGDALSDSYMKEYVDHFAAPDDGHPEVVAGADYIFPTAKEGGMVKLISHLLASEASSQYR